MLIFSIFNDKWLRKELLGKPSRGKSDVFLNIVQKAFDPPPPFYLNICPILRGVFFNNVETDMKYL